MVVYDTAVLVALERGERAVAVEHQRLLQDGFLPVVPAGVLAQAWRGGERQARLAMALHGCTIRALDEDDARAAGALCAEVGTEVGTPDVIDASVVVAAHPGSLVLTSDVEDLRALAVAAGKPLRILPLPL